MARFPGNTCWVCGYAVCADCGRCCAESCAMCSCDAERRGECWDRGPTPGPWVAKTGRANTSVYAGAYAVAVGCCPADARLIAAAPALLQAARRVLREGVGGDHVPPAVLLELQQAVDDALEGVA